MCVQRELCGVQPEAEGDSQDVHTNKHKGISQACLLLRLRERETARTRSPAQAAQHSQARQTARGGSCHCTGRSADIVAISSASLAGRQCPGCWAGPYSQRTRGRHPALAGALLRAYMYVPMLTYPGKPGKTHVLNNCRLADHEGHCNVIK